MRKQIIIPFHDSMKNAIIEGKKICTNRNKKYGNTGDYFILNGNMYRLTLVLRGTLEEVASNYYKDEGFLSREDFVSMWNTLHPILGYVPTKKVYTHWFREEVITENSIPQPRKKQVFTEKEVNK